MNKISIENLTLFKTPEDSPGYLLWRISFAWRSYIEETLKPLGLTHPQFVVLTTIAWLTRDGKHINQIDISKASELDPNTISQILRRLEAKHFIKRIRFLNERSKNSSLTDLGFKVLEKTVPAVEKSDLKFFKSLTAHEMGILVKLFQKIIPL